MKIERDIDKILRPPFILPHPLLTKLLENTPHLRYLNTLVIDYSESENEFPTINLSLTKLNLYTRVTTNLLSCLEIFTEFISSNSSYGKTLS